jgi:hypothetical protein
MQCRHLPFCQCNGNYNLDHRHDTSAIAATKSQGDAATAFLLQTVSMEVLYHDYPTYAIRVMAPP